MKNKIKVTGMVRLEHFDEHGKLLQDTGFQKNIITNAGLAAIAGLVGNTGGITAFSYLAVGTSSTAAAASQTTLVAEIVDSGLQRVSATVSRVTTTQTNDTLQLTTTFSVSGTKTVNEAGIFNASSGGTMLGRKVTNAVSLVSGQSLTVTYKVIFT